MESVDRRLAAKRARPGGHLVEHAPEREDVRAVVDRASLRLLGRHVANGAHDDSRRGPGRERRLFRGRGEERRLCAQLRQAEIQHLDVSACRNHQVFGLDVAVDDAGGVRGRQRVGGLHRVVEHLLEIAVRSIDQIAERHAVDQLHRDEMNRPALAGRLRLPDVVD